MLITGSGFAQASVAERRSRAPALSREWRHGCSSHHRSSRLFNAATFQNDPAGIWLPHSATWREMALASCECLSGVAYGSAESHLAARNAVVLRCLQRL